MPNLLPDDTELAQIRSDLEASLLPDKCNILEVTRTSDGQGGYTETWGTATGGSSIACKIDSTKAYEEIAGGALQPYHTYVLTLPYGTSIAEANRVEVGSTTYNVTSVDSGKSWNVCVRAYLERL